MAELIKQGFNPTTAGLMYTGKNISEKILNKVLKGEEYQLPKDTEVNIERGNKFMTLCKAAHIDVTFLTKRYFIKGFNSYAKATSEEQAFEALDKLKLLNLDEVQLKGIKEEDEFVAMLKEAFETQVWPDREPMWQVGSSTPNSQKVVIFPYTIMLITPKNRAKKCLKSD